MYPLVKQTTNEAPVIMRKSRILVLNGKANAPPPALMEQIAQLTHPPTVSTQASIEVDMEFLLLKLWIRRNTEKRISLRHVLIMANSQILRCRRAILTPTEELTGMHTRRQLTRSALYSRIMSCWEPTRHRRLLVCRK